MKYEYKIHKIDNSRNPTVLKNGLVIDELNALGKEGWRVIRIVGARDDHTLFDDRVTVLLEREKPS